LEKTSYAALLDHFWKAHSCQSAGYSSQYRKAIFTRSDAQRVLAEQSLHKHAQTLGIKPEAVTTPIIPIDNFTIAEKYHHKYSLRNGSPIRSFLEKTYPEIKEFADSSVAMRLNSITGSRDVHGWRIIHRELLHYGLPPEIESQLAAISI